MEALLAVFIVIFFLGTFPLHMKFWEDIARNQKFSVELMSACIFFSLPMFPLIGLYQLIKEIFKK